jgi:hypothetical protein
MRGLLGGGIDANGRKLAHSRPRSILGNVFAELNNTLRPVVDVERETDRLHEIHAASISASLGWPKVAGLAAAARCGVGSDWR